MINQDDEILNKFIDESKDHLVHIEEDLLAIEQQGENFDYELVNCVFRAFHAVKGGAMFFGLYNLSKLAYCMEVVLDRIRRRELVMSADMADSLLTGAELLNQMLNDPGSIEYIDISKAKKNFENILSISLSEEEKAESDVCVDIKLPDGKVIFSVNKYDFQRASEEDRGGSNVYLIKYDLIKDIEEKNKTPWEVISELLQLCVFIDSKVDIDCIGTLDSGMPASLPFYVLISTIIDIELISDLLELAEENIYYVGKDGLVKNSVSKNPDIVESIMDYMIQDSNDLGVAGDSCNISDGAEKKRERVSERDSVMVRREVLDMLEQHAKDLIIARDLLVQNCECGAMDSAAGPSKKIMEIARQLQQTVASVRGKLSASAKRVNQEFGQEKDSADRQSLIIFNCGSEHLAMPLGLVSKLEKIGKDQLLVRKTAKYIEYQGKELELIFAPDIVAKGKLIQHDEYIVAVIKLEDEEIGLVFNSIAAILNAEAKIAPVDNQFGIIGQLNIKGRMVWLLDIYQIIFTVKPEWNIYNSDTVGLDVKGVLVLENSEFFMNYIKSVVQKSGFTVFSARSGEEALDAIKDYGQDIGLIFAAIRMPGFSAAEFAGKLQGAKQQNIMQVIALTSVAGEESKRLYCADLFKDYVVKLDSYNIIKKCCDLLLAAQ